MKQINLFVRTNAETPIPKIQTSVLTSIQRITDSDPHFPELSLATDQDLYNFTSWSEQFFTQLCVLHYADQDLRVLLREIRYRLYEINRAMEKKHVEHLQVLK